MAIGFAIISAYYFTLFSATNTKLTGLVKKVDFLAVEGELSKLYWIFKIHTPPSLPLEDGFDGTFKLNSNHNPQNKVSFYATFKH